MTTHAIKVIEMTQADELAAIRRMFSESDHVICPMCPADGWGDWNHIQKPMYFKGGDDYKAEKAFNMGVRGDVLAIPFGGECGHRWALVFGEHKGHICFKLVIYEDPSNESLPVYEGDEEEEQSA